MAVQGLALCAALLGAFSVMAQPSTKDVAMTQDSLSRAQFTVHRAKDRGHADHGWLDTHHSFSFAGWHAPDRMHFGAMRVLNDDVVAGGGGFGMHPHDNMEIVSIPTLGALEHQDSMGNSSVIRTGDVQIMSAQGQNVHLTSRFNAMSCYPVKRKT